MQRMLADINRETHLTRQLTGMAALDQRVMNAMAKVPRDQFVPDGQKAMAFDNGPLPIGQGQTISQPYIVALMTHLLAPEPHQHVLEIGSGSGYQTAVLSLLYHEVYSMELIPALSDAAAARLARLGYTNTHLCCGNGYQGWPEHAPYHGIIVTAAAPRIPTPLLEQLVPGGRMVIPVGLPHSSQQLLLINRDTENRIRSRNILGVAFVPLVDRAPTVGSNE